jgi:two-component system nitrogen regulation response regulator GlnG
MSPLPQEELDTLISLLRSDSAAGEGDLYRRALEHFDRVIVRRAMEQSGGNLTKAAERLGLSRVTLRAKVRAMRRRVQTVDASPAEAQHC